MSNCRECKQPINTGASKCHHCGGYQSRLRIIFGTGVLVAGFILTWISIWAAPPVKELLEAKRADIKVSILEGGFSYIVFMIANTGNQPAGLAHIEIESELEHGTGSWYLSSELDKQLLEPGKAHIVKAVSSSHSVPEAISHEHQHALDSIGFLDEVDTCNLVVAYVQMSGTKEYMYHPFPCSPDDPNKESVLK